MLFVLKVYKLISAFIRNSQVESIKSCTNLQDRGLWGGTKVDEAFHLMIIKIVGASFFQKVKDEFKIDDLDIQRTLETKKRTVKPDSNSNISINLPLTLVGAFEEKKQVGR